MALSLRKAVGLFVTIVAFAIFLLLFRFTYYLMFGSLPPDGAIGIGVDILALWAAIGTAFWFNAYRARTLASRVKQMEKVTHE